jgi:membrane-associated phospholipid phosphatase
MTTRYRPYAYAASGADFSSADIAASFPSRHATIAFASAVFAGYAFDEINPGSAWSPLVWASGLGLATATSALRVASGDHFPSDVLAGAVLGAACGYLVPLLHKATNASGGDSGLEAALSPAGFSLSLRLD